MSLRRYLHGKQQIDAGVQKQGVNKGGIFGELSIQVIYAEVAIQVSVVRQPVAALKRRGDDPRGDDPFMPEPALDYRPVPSCPQ